MKEVRTRFVSFVVAYLVLQAFNDYLYYYIVAIELPIRKILRSLPARGVRVEISSSKPPNPPPSPSPQGECGLKYRA